MNVVFELREDDYEGQRYGLFATRALVEAEIVRLALDGGTPKLAIYELNVQGEPGEPGAAEQLVGANWDDQAAADAMRATPLPWHVTGPEIVDAQGRRVADSVDASETGTREDAALTELVVRLVNRWALQSGLLK